MSVRSVLESKLHQRRPVFIEIEHTRSKLAVMCDGKTLIEVARGDDENMERIADILAAKRLSHQADQVRKLLYGR
jgi:hypothetical protein